MTIVAIYSFIIFMLIFITITNSISLLIVMAYQPTYFLYYYLVTEYLVNYKGDALYHKNYKQVYPTNPSPFKDFPRRFLLLTFLLVHIYSILSYSLFIKRNTSPPIFVIDYAGSYISYHL
jgi:hypothetical protein